MMNEGGNNKLVWWLIALLFFFTTDFGKFLLKYVWLTLKRLLILTIASGGFFLLGAILIRVME